MTFSIHVVFALAADVVNAYYAARGRPLEDRSGALVVLCPRCQYSMVGLESCQCPECGTAYTVDRLIKEQNYALRRRVEEEPGAVDAVPDTPALPAS